MSTDGHVVAVNVAVVRTDPWTEVKSGRSGIDKRPVDGPVRLLSYGVAGDTICDTANHGGSDQAVYAYACEDLAFWAAELGQRMDPGGVGENLTLSAVDCSAAVVGERWQVGAVMAAMTVDRDRVTRVAAAGEHLGARGQDWLDRTLFNLRSTVGRR